MSDDPRFNPYRKKALEHGIKNGWDFADFMPRSAPEKNDENIKVAQSLQTILRKILVPEIPHAPNFAQYLYEILGEGIKCCPLKKEEPLENNFLKDTYEIIHQGHRIGIYAIWVKKKGDYYACAFEGKIHSQSYKLTFQQKKRKDKSLEIPFP